MPYRVVYTTKLSLCGDTYTELSVVFDEVIDHAPLSDDEVSNLLGKQLYENASQNSRILDPDWDQIPF